MVGRDLAIARYEGAPVHICHVSAAESVAEIRRARELGVDVTAEVTPHHLCLTDEHVRSLDAARSKMSPPLRSATDRAALIEALADGTIDCIGTDHAPHRGHEKEQPFAQAPNGVIGLETAFSAIYTHLVEPGLVPLSTVIERMSAGPAAAFGLPRPALREGEAAEPEPVGPGRELARAAAVRLAVDQLRLRGADAARPLPPDDRGRVRRPPPDRGGRVMPAFLVLEDGTVYRGRPYAAHGIAVGELVFTTSMTGYQEVVTDPSFAGQLVTFTQPMIGNYGVEPDASESDGPHARAVIVREGRNAAPGGRTGFSDWLAEHGVVGLQGIDTRAITRRLRDGGAVRAAVSSGTATVDEVLEAVRAAPEMAGQALAGQVSRSAAQAFAAEGPERAHVVVLDYGVKGSIVRLLCEAGARVTVMPWDAPAADVLAAVARRDRPRQRARRPRRAPGLRRRGARHARRQAGVRDLPRPPAARPGSRPRDVQAALRPPRREPPGARPRLRPRARDRPEPRVRGARARDRPRLHDRVRRRASSPTRRSTTAPSRGSPCAIATSPRSSSTPRPAPARTTPGRP